MASYTQSSLFEPSPDSSLTQASEWIDAVVFGEVAIALCVLAVAFVGFAMLTGRFAMRGGLRVLLGCFVLLGAPVIASGDPRTEPNRSIAGISLRTTNGHNESIVG